MQQPQKARMTRGRGRWVLALGAICIVSLAGFGWLRWQTRRPASEHRATAGVKRADLFPTTKATGRLESTHQTIVECQLENIAVGIRGQRLSSDGASTLLTVVPEGTIVKRGDVLATLDSADFDEMLRLQQITVLRAKADKLQGDLDLDIAKMAVREFLEGTVQETIEDYEGRIFLARSDLERAADRLAWSRRMNDKGYIPAATVTADAFRKAQMTVSLEQQQGAYQVFKKYTVPKTRLELEGAVKGAIAIAEYQQLRLQRHLARLALIEKQLANCTIRAPHDGMVIYANNLDRQIVIEAGVPVYQQQRLFYLPDLNEMEVIANLHESIVDQIGTGLRAKVSIEGMRDRRLEGHIQAVAPVSLFNVRSDVRYFESIVKLDHTIAGLKPGMTAEVEIALPRRENVLAVPPQAVWYENGHDVCLVVHDERLEVRPVKVGQVTCDLTEITAGLAEGEEIVLNPSHEDFDDDAPTQIAHGEPAGIAPAGHAGTSSSIATR
jgi:HlyD family secretion protein